MHIRKTTLSIVSTMFLATLPVAASAEFNPTDEGAYQGGQINATQTVWREALDRAIDRVINPDDYICNSPTDFDLWVNAQFFAIDPILVDVIIGLDIFSWAGDSKLVMDQNDSDEYIGVKGEHTRRQNRTFKDNRRFWDIDSSDILLQGMHGADIADDSIMYPFIDWGFGRLSQCGRAGAAAGHSRCHRRARRHRWRPGPRAGQNGYRCLQPCRP